MIEDLKDGVDFLTDYYAVLDVDRDATLDTIKNAYHKKLRVYHPDKYDHLAAEFRIQAERTTGLCNKAYETLSDANKRERYDKLLNAWTGPISQNGNPVIDLNRAYFSPRILFGQNPESDTQMRQIEERAKQMTAYNASLLTLLQAQYALAPNEELRALIQDQLNRKQIYLCLKEEWAWREIGWNNRAVKQIGYDHATAVANELQAIEDSLNQDAQRYLLSFDAGARLLLGNSASDDESPVVSQEDASTALNLVCQTARLRLYSAREKIISAAEAVEAVQAERLTFLKMDYVETQEVLFPRFIICLVFEKGQTHSTAFFFDEQSAEVRNVNPDGFSDRDNLLDGAIATQWIDLGYNVIITSPEDQINLLRILEEIAAIHVERFLATK